jgi:hypothetical protein
MIYPLVTWVVSVPAFTVDVEMNGVTETLNVPDGAYYGWLTTGTDSGDGLLDPATGSIGLLIQDVLNTHSESFGCSSRYGTASTLLVGGMSTYGTAIGIYLQDLPSDTAVTATSNTAALRSLGLESGDVLGGECVIARRTAGVWRPKFAPPARLEPVYTAIGSGAMSEYNAGTQDRLLFGGRLIWSVVWEYVEAADISRELLNIADYLPLANRATGDTNGTFDDLLYALARGAEVLLALPPRGVSGDAAILYQECVVDNPGNFSRDAYTTEAAVGARRYNVTMAFTETQDYEP